MALFYKLQTLFGVIYIYLFASASDRMRFVGVADEALGVRAARTALCSCGQTRNCRRIPFSVTLS